jgi:PAS domain S-box-containing protein
MRNKSLIARLLRQKYLLQLSSLCLILVLAFWVDRINIDRSLQQLRSETLIQGSVIRARLEGVIASNIQTVRGLEIFIQQNPNIDQALFEKVASRLISGKTQIRNIGAAPNMVLSLMYPMEGNRAAIGLNYLTHPTQGAAAQQARDSGHMVLSGPLNLVQGGVGVIGRIPVFYKTEQGEKFWGLISTVLDVDAIYRAAELEQFTQAYDLVLRGKEGKGADGEVFYGDPAVLDNHPVTLTVQLPQGQWQLVMTPKGGWALPADKVWPFRLVVLTIAVIFIVGLWYLFRLLNFRDRDNRRLQRALKTLELTQKDLASLVDNIPGITFRCRNDENRTLLFISHQCKFLTGYVADELLTAADLKGTGSDKVSYAQLIHPQDREALKAKVQHAVDQQVPWQLEYRLYDKFGECHWVMERGVPIIDDAGNLEHLDGVVLDITDRKNIEQELALKNKELENFFEQSNSLMCIANKDGGFEKVNQMFVKSLGYSEHELLNMTFIELTHPDDLEASLAQVKALKQGQSTLNFENRIRRKDGSYIHLMWFAAPDNVAKKVYATAIDVTEHRKTQEQLKEQQALLETMSELGRIGAWEVDLRTNSLHWSSMTKKIHEVPPDFEPELDTAINFYKEGYSRERITLVVNRAIEQGIPWSEELQLITQKGREIWVAARGEAKFENGECVKLYGSFQDISERKISELENQKSARLNAVLATLTVDPDILEGHLERAKETISRLICEALEVERGSIWLFNQEQDEMTCIDLYLQTERRHRSGMVLQKSRYPTYFRTLTTHAHIAASDVYQHPATAEFIEHYLKPLGITSMLDAVIPGGDGIVGVVCAEHVGERRLWSQTEESFLIAVGTIVGSIWQAEQRKKTEAKLIAATEQAIAAAKAKSDFLASMSHEIRTPMNAVIGTLELLKTSSLDNLQMQQLELVHTSAMSLLHIVNDILDFSKIEAGKLDLEVIDFDLVGLLSSVVESFMQRAEEKGLNLILDLRRVSHQFVKGDPGRLRQILTNLLSNAIKFTEQGEIVVRAWSKDKSNQQLLFGCSVKDTGIGIAPEHVNLLFAPFTQADASTTRRYGGTGLGLAIVKQLCELMNGRISVTSCLDQGSEFVFELELAESNMDLTEIAQWQLNGARILLIDDSKTSREIHTDLLQRWGAEVEVFNSGSEAIASLSQTCEPYEVIVVDLKSTDSTAAEVCRAVRSKQDFQNTKLLVLCSFAARGDAKTYAELGFDGYLPKPVTPSELYNALTRLIALDRMTQGHPLLTRHLLREQKDRLSDEKSSILQLPQFSGLSALLVEDNKVNQMVAKAMLAKLGVEVTLAENGVDAIDKLKAIADRSQLQLVFMDCQMPEMDGYEATRCIRQGEAGDLWRDIPIIALTANALKGDREKCVEAGMDDYITKPITLDALIKLLSQWQVKLNPSSV